ncbi:MAG: hypothetical protein LUC43_06185, partial [Burkholderiales bacterium]|nr:hypothetical protein [Burkholderiales bacterium]
MDNPKPTVHYLNINDKRWLDLYELFDGIGIFDTETRRKIQQRHIGLNQTRLKEVGGKHLKLVSEEAAISCAGSTPAKLSNKLPKVAFARNPPSIDLWLDLVPFEEDSKEVPQELASTHLSAETLGTSTSLDNKKIPNEVSSLEGGKVSINKIARETNLPPNQRSSNNQSLDSNSSYPVNTHRASGTFKGFYLHGLPVTPKTLRVDFGFGYIPVQCFEDRYGEKWYEAIELAQSAGLQGTETQIFQTVLNWLKGSHGFLTWDLLDTRGKEVLKRIAVRYPEGVIICKRIEVNLSKNLSPISNTLAYPESPQLPPVLARSISQLSLHSSFDRD